MRESVRGGVVVLLMTLALGGCSDDVPQACVSSPSISGDLAVRWHRMLGYGEAPVMRLRPDGSLVMAGRILAPLTPDSGPVQAAFVQALDRDGQVLWNRYIPGSWRPRDLAADGDGNVYLVGDLSGTAVDLGKGNVGGVLVLAKLDAAGETSFSTSIDALTAKDMPAVPESLHLAVSGTGVVALAGEVARASLATGFVARFDASSGGFLSRQDLGASVGPKQIAFDAAGGLIVAGRLGDPKQGTLAVGPVPLAGEHNSFMLYEDASGVAIWARALGEYSNVTSLVVDGARAFLAGTFSGTLAVDDFSASAQGSSDNVILSIDGLGTGSAPTLAPWSILPGGGREGLLIAADGQGGAVAVGGAFELFAVEDQLFSPQSLMVFHLDESARLTAHAAFGMASWSFEPTSVVRDAGGTTYALGAFGGLIDFDGKEPLQTPNGSILAGLFLVALGPESASTPSVSCPVPLGLLVDSWSAPMPTHLALAGDTVLSTTDSTVTALPIDGGKPRLLALAQKHVSALKVWRDQVIWVNSGTQPPLGPGKDGSIVMMPVAGGAAKVLADGLDNPRAVDTDGTTLYWTSGGESSTGTSVQFTGSLLSAPMAGGTPVVLASGFPWVGPVAVAGGGVVFGAGDGPSTGRVIRIPAGGGPMVDLSLTDGKVTSLASDGVAAYWTEGNEPAGTFGQGRGALRRAPLSGGRATTLMETWDHKARILAIVNGQLYWNAEVRQILRVPVSGGAVSRFRTENFGEIAMDDHHLVSAIWDPFGGWTLKAVALSVDRPRR